MNLAREQAKGPGRLTIQRGGRFLVVRLGETHDVASWAIVGGGVREASAVTWMEVDDRELRPPVDPVCFFRDRLEHAGLGGSVGLMTSRTLDAYVETVRDEGSATASCVATVGLGNALRAGDPPGAAGRIGTINILCRVDRPLTSESILEALAIATEAKTAAIVEAGIASRRSGLRATGTGTDVVVIAAPKHGAVARYAGKHTDVGAAIGGAVEEAVRLGALAWITENYGQAPR